MRFKVLFQKHNRKSNIISRELVITLPAGFSTSIQKVWNTVSICVLPNHSRTILVCLSISKYQIMTTLHKRIGPLDVFFVQVWQHFLMFMYSKLLSYVSIHSHRRHSSMAELIKPTCVLHLPCVRIKQIKQVFFREDSTRFIVG